MCYSPVRHSLGSCNQSAFDLHVLGTPPAFILSQDQTRHPMFIRVSQRRLTFCVDVQVCHSTDRYMCYLSCIPYLGSLFSCSGALSMPSHLLRLSGASEMIPLHPGDVKRFFHEFSESVNSLGTPCGQAHVYLKVLAGNLSLSHPQPWVEGHYFWSPGSGSN